MGAFARTLLLGAAMVATACFVDEGSTPIVDDPGTTSGASTGPEGASAGSTASGGDPSTGDDPSTSGGGATDGNCSDGMIDASEACDDGNDIDGDGCSATCTIEPASKLYAFATLGTFNGNLGTLADADSKCASEAANNGLPGTYFAWLSVGGVAPATRFIPHNLPIVLPGSGEPLVAMGTAQLYSSDHAGALDRGPDGLPVADGGSDRECDAGSLAWTGTKNDGTAHDDRCDDFASGDEEVTGLAGELMADGHNWSARCSASCSRSLHLYCFQQP